MTVQVGHVQVDSLSDSTQPTWPLNGKFNHGNLTGAGVAIYIVDTGVFLNHAEFGGAAGPSRAKWGADCTGASSQCLTAFPPAEARAATGDCNGHGTRGAGIAAGRCGSGLAYHRYALSACGSMGVSHSQSTLCLQLEVQIAPASLLDLALASVVSARRV